MIEEAKVGHDLSKVEPNGGYVKHDNGGCGRDFTLFKHDIGKVEPAGGYVEHEIGGYGHDFTLSKHDIGKVEPAGGYVEHEIGGYGHDFGDFGKRPARFLLIFCNDGWVGNW